MLNPSILSLVIFAAYLITIFINTFINKKEASEINQTAVPLLKQGLVLSIALVFFTLGAILDFFSWATLAYFSIAYVASSALNRIKVNSDFVLSLELGLSVILSSTFNLSDALPTSALATILGFLLPSLNFNSVLTVVPSVTWLLGFLFFSEAQQEAERALVLVCLSLALSIGFIRKKFLNTGCKEDNLKLCFLILLVSALFWILIRNVFLLPKLDYWAWSFGVALLVNWSLANLGSLKSELKVFLLLSVLGLSTLLASRLIGAKGWLVLVATTCAFLDSAEVLLASLFWQARLLLQNLILHFNWNITGVNLMHPYVSAAQFAGFAAGLILLFYIDRKSVKNEQRNMLLSTAVVFVLPLTANYFLHEEASISFHLAFLVSSLLLCLFWSIFKNSKPEQYQAEALLYPLMVSGAAVLFHEALKHGNESSKLLKMVFLTALFVLIISLSVLQKALSKRASVNVL